MLHDLSKFKIIKDKTLGYEVVYYPEHPYARKGSKVIYLHRLVMENFLNRYLTPDEHIHHKDEDRSNNVIENLDLTTNSEHGKHHHKPLENKKCKVCDKEYKPDKSKRQYCSPECYAKSKEKIEWPSIEFIEKELKIKSMVQLGKELGVSDNAIRKYIKRSK